MLITVLKYSTFDLFDLQKILLFARSVSYFYFERDLKR